MNTLLDILRLGGLLARLIDWLDDMAVVQRERAKRKAEQDALIDRARNVRAGELPDDPRDYRD